ncbi:MAG TPA: helicase-related protein, partial [Bacilli bacterium]|nr:helicase-related protein [Bacilli bacterium]
KIKITIKIFDEAHVEFTSIFKLDMISNLRSIYLSATPKRSDRAEDKVYQNMFRNVTRFSSDTIQEEPENYHNIIIYNWNSNPGMMDEANCQTKYGFSMSRYCDYLMKKKYNEFEEFLYSVIFDTALSNRKKRKLAILFGTNALLDKFYDSLVGFCESNKYKLKVNKFNGQTKKEDKLTLLEESDIIITTDKSFYKGLDVKDLQVVINTVPFTADTKLIQTVGRLRKLPNKEVTFIDINDLGYKTLRYQESSKKTVFSTLAKSLFVVDYYK